MAKVCIVMGTPIGIGIEICAIIAITAVHKAIVQMSCTESFDCFIMSSLYCTIWKADCRAFKEVPDKVIGKKFCRLSIQNIK